jgi:RHS repeat-associated protein
VGWNIFETRNGSNQATRQWVWGTRYVDEVLFMDVNGSPASDNDCDPDTTVGGMESGYDRRYFYHQDRNWNVVALTEYADGVGTNGRVAERYAYTPYGEFVVLKGDPGTGELGRALVASTVGNPFAHQGLPFDREKGSYQNRHRELPILLQRFAQRDRPYDDGASLYRYTRNLPTLRLDPSGLCSSGECQDDAVSGGMHRGRTCCREITHCYLVCDPWPRTHCPRSHHYCHWDSDGCHKPPAQPGDPMVLVDCGVPGAIPHKAGDLVDDHSDCHGPACGTWPWGTCIFDVSPFGGWWQHMYYDVGHLDDPWREDC